MSLTEQEISEIKNLLSTPKAICVLTHRNPDGDALGSSLAIKYFLEKFNHTVKIILPSEYPLNLSFLKDIDDCLVFDLDQKLSLDTIKEAEVIFCLDFNSLDRIDKMGMAVQESRATKLLIDHHLDPEPFADYIFSDTAASSTCELIHRFIFDLGESHRIDPIIGEALFKIGRAHV